MVKGCPQVKKNPVKFQCFFLVTRDVFPFNDTKGTDQGVLFFILIKQRRNYTRIGQFSMACDSETTPIRVCMAVIKAK